MGTYVYALNTKVREVSGVTLGLAEYRYKEYGMFNGGEETNEKLYKRLCGQRVKFFKDHPEQMPKFMVLGRMEEGWEVFVCPGVVTSGDLPSVGKLKKVGRSWTIVWKEGFDPNAVPEYSEEDSF